MAKTKNQKRGGQKVRNKEANAAARAQEQAAAAAAEAKAKAKAEAEQAKPSSPHPTSLFYRFQPQKKVAPKGGSYLQG